MTKILIVDDSSFMRKMLRKILMDAKYELIVEAENGKEGLASYKKEKPDLVLLDIIMEKMDGIECLKGIMKENKKAKVIMVSAVGQEQMVKGFTSLGKLEKYLCRKRQKKD